MPLNKKIEDMSEKEYRATPYESFSSLKSLLKSPDEFKFYKENPFKGSNSTLLGTCIHHYLQGNRHLVAFSVVDRRKKEEYAKFESDFRELAGEEGIIVPKSFEVTLNHIMKSFNENPQAVSLVEGAEIEKAYLVEYEDRGEIFPYKCKLDGVGDDYVLEIKSSSQATTAAAFKQEVADRHYDLQAAMYLYAANKSRHFFIVVNTVAPYNVKLYRTSDDTLENGRSKFFIIKAMYKKYIVSGESYDRREEIEQI